MKRCPSCNRTYSDLSLNFCLEDGTPLTVDAPPASGQNATIRYPSPRDTVEPPPTEIYRPETPPVTQPPSFPPPPQLPQPPKWTPTPGGTPPKKSNALWWILGGLAAAVVIGVGVIVMIIALASIGSTVNDNNSNANTNVRVTNRNANDNSGSDSNSNKGALRASFSDDFSEEKWGVGDSKFGKIWYADGEYHMSSKERTFVVMYAPSDDYSTEDAIVKVTARSVDGTVPSAGFGLMVHCAQSKTKQLEDYALLIYPSEDPEYEVIMHKDGNQTPLVPRTPSSAIRPGTTPNQLEIRIKGTELLFYVNGQYLTKITDNENYKRGRAGLYTSGTTEVAFDDLEINR